MKRLFLKFLVISLCINYMLSLNCFAMDSFYDSCSSIKNTNIASYKNVSKSNGGILVSQNGKVSYDIPSAESITLKYVSKLSPSAFYQNNMLTLAPEMTASNQIFRSSDEFISYLYGQNIFLKSTKGKIYKVLNELNGLIVEYDSPLPSCSYYGAVVRQVGDNRSTDANISNIKTFVTYFNNGIASYETNVTFSLSSGYKKIEIINNFANIPFRLNEVIIMGIKSVPKKDEPVIPSELPNSPSESQNETISPDINFNNDNLDNIQSEHIILPKPDEAPDKSGEMVFPSLTDGNKGSSSMLDENSIKSDSYFNSQLEVEDMNQENKPQAQKQPKPTKPTKKPKPKIAPKEKKIKSFHSPAPSRDKSKKSNKKPSYSNSKSKSNSKNQVEEDETEQIFDFDTRKSTSINFSTLMTILLFSASFFAFGFVLAKNIKNKE